MTVSTPKSARLAVKRKSIMSGQFRHSVGGNALPRPQTSLRASRVSNFRASTSQPQYDIITGADNAASSPFVKHNTRHGQTNGESVRASSRESSKENLAPPDAEEYETQRKRIEELKAELAAMHYKCDNYEKEKEMTALEHENEIRECRRKADEDFSKRQDAEGEKGVVERRIESVMSEFAELKESAERDARALEKKARESDSEARLLQEQLDDLSAVKEESDRMNQKRISDLELQASNLRESMEAYEKENQSRDELLQQAQEQLAQKDEIIGELEANVLRLKAQTGDADTIAVIRRELSDHVQYIRNLESKNTKMHSDLSHYKQIHKAVEVVEEEKRSLQRKLEAAAGLEAELAEARIQRQRLEDERLAWTSYLRNASDDMMEFDSPEHVARALVEERYTSASLTQKLGEFQEQLGERDGIIKSLEAEIGTLKTQIDKLKTAPSALPADKTRARLERQRALAAKEVEYLRAQLKTFDAEDETFEPEKVDEVRNNRVAELEKLVDNYKSEVNALHEELSSAEVSGPAEAKQLTGTKRPREEDAIESETISELNRKRQALLNQVAEKDRTLNTLQVDYQSLRERLEAAEKKNKTRVLSLHSNPTAEWEAIKVATLTALKEENKQLLTQLQKANRNPPFPVIPASQLANAKREVEEAQRETASAMKSAQRLKQVWGAKSNEFKEAIFSTLGWTVTFIPNGKMRVESVFNPSQTDEHENSIVFDGERGTMKVSGGPQSVFARSIADQIQFWVRDKGCIPGFLAALTLEFYEQHNNKQE
ncbi:spindle assembly checkpoint component mad1 [Apiospora marii]|uniref:Spindle assembly checkpoint component MAD1 n=1 Tax=Apiospora marii TaxID=335849 RepID=A0ABR1S936_9PEZI